jgi:Flp pilus assembly protein TadG
MSIEPKIIEVSPMRKMCLSLVRRALNDQRGQTLPLAAMGMVAMLGVAGLTVDVGHAYIVRSQLQNTANAAALAAAGEVYNSSTTTGATAVANTYGGGATTDENGNSVLGAVSTTVYTGCVNALLPSGSTCSSSTPVNAVQVQNSVKVPTFFLKLFGFPALTVGATATASMQGASNPWNVAVIIDATESMTSTTDSNCSTGTASRFTCALESVQTLLEAIPPCTGLTGSSCTPAAAQFRVALFAFPNVTKTTRPDDYGCSGTIPTPEQYTLPLPPPLSAYTPLTYNGNLSTYQVTLPSTGNADAYGFMSDYRSTSTSNNLNASSEIVKAIGGANGCTAMATAGGESTYYASIIYAAQAALKAEQAGHANSKNAIILISDGEAQAVNTKFPATGSAATPSASGYSVVTNSTSNTKNLVGGTKGYYPDFNDECQQAIMAAQAAATAGTRVYAVAYGSESSGCTSAGGGTDTTLIATTGLNQTFTLSGASALTPCITMENIASSLNYFYSDYNQSGSGSTCVDNSHTTVNLSDISLAIASTFTKPKLLPNNSLLYPTT